MQIFEPVVHSVANQVVVTAEDGETLLLTLLGVECHHFRGTVGVSEVGKGPRYEGPTGLPLDLREHELGGTSQEALQVNTPREFLGQTLGPASTARPLR